MPKPKKQSANWYIAATHYLTAGFVIPFIGGLALGFVHYFIVLPQSDILALAISAVESAILICLGVVYGARFVNRRYVITDASKIVKLATIYYVVLASVGWAASLLFLSLVPVEQGVIATGITSSVVNIGLFYILSKKYIQSGQ